MEPELSIPVLWSEDGAAPNAGRLDLLADHLHLDGGPRGERRTRDVAYGEIRSARIGRSNGDRVKGRPAIVLGLAAGGILSLASVHRPGTLVELLHRIESAL